MSSPREPDAREDEDPQVIKVARAIAEQGFGRPWNDFLPVNAHDTDQGDLIEYARAAVAALRQPAAPGGSYSCPCGIGDKPCPGADGRPLCASPPPSDERAKVVEEVWQHFDTMQDDHMMSIEEIKAAILALSPSTPPTESELRRARAPAPAGQEE